jgi:hypothetical protein
VNCLSLSPCSSADLSSHGSVAWGLQRGKVGSLLWSLARRCGSSGFAPIRPHVDLLCWLSLPRPTKEWPYDLLDPWAFREVFYSFSGPGGYLSPTPCSRSLHGRRSQRPNRRNQTACGRNCSLQVRLIPCSALSMFAPPSATTQLGMKTVENDRKTAKLFLFSYFLVGTKTKTNGRNTRSELSVIWKRSKTINYSRKDKYFVVLSKI